MTTHTQTPTCPDSFACHSDTTTTCPDSYTSPECGCYCHTIPGARENAQHYLAQARERRRAANNLKSIAADIRDSADPLNHELLDADRIERAAELLDKWGSEIDDRNMPVTVISDTGIQQGTLHADDSITVDPVTIPQPGDKPSGYPNDYNFNQDPGLEILGDGVVIASATDPARGWHVTGEPSIEQLRDWSDNGGMEAIDGCGGIEDDGTCEHGAPSWMLHLNLI